MAKSERDELLSKLTSMLFSAMLDDIVLDATLQSHYEVQKLNTVCEVCHTRCGSAHASSSATAVPSRAGTPDVILQSQPTNASGSGAGGTTGANTPTNGKSDGNIYFECLNCKRQGRSPRIDMRPIFLRVWELEPGIGGELRGLAPPSSSPSALSAESGRSASPYFGSDNGIDDPKNQSVKGKGKSKTTRKDDAEFNLHRKRPGSPQISPKKSKKIKTSGSPLKNSTEVMPPPTSKKPSQLRASSTTSDMIQDREGSASASVDNDSRISVFSPEATPMTPTSSTDSASNSVTLTNGTAKSGSANPPKTGNIGTSKAKSVTPSRPPPPMHKMPDPNYMMLDFEGEETGSSTDSESD